MAKIPQMENTTLSKISEVEYGGEPRPYLGMSSIGDKCLRKLWYSFHWTTHDKKHNSKAERIFNIGHAAEQIMIADLKSVGVEVYRDVEGERIPMTGAIGEEQEELAGFAGHARGHPDGRCLNIIEAPKTPHLLEMKTAKDNIWNKIKKEGVKKAKEGHYYQMIRYMGNMGLTRAFYICLNKNTAEYYTERVYFDQSEYDDLIRKEQMVIISDRPLDRMPGASPRWYDCKWCNHHEVCHQQGMPDLNCRTCNRSDVLDNGVWSCRFHDKTLSVEEQRVGCEYYEKGWNL